MKNLFLLLMFVTVFIFMGMTTVFADDQEEQEIEKASSVVDQDSHDPGKAQRVEKKLEEKFNVSDARVDELRKQNLGYGEIGTVLSLANQMPGGINDENVKKIMDLRQGQSGHKQGWGKIAKNLNLKLRPAITDLEDVGSKHRDPMDDRAQRNNGNEEKMGEKVQNIHHGSDNHESKQVFMKPQTPSSFHGMGHNR